MYMVHRSHYAPPLTPLLNMVTELKVTLVMYETTYQAG